MVGDVIERPPESRLRKLLEIIFMRGAGIVGDPVREVSRFFDTTTGLLVFELDPCKLDPDIVIEASPPGGSVSLLVPALTAQEAVKLFTWTRDAIGRSVGRYSALREEEIEMLAYFAREGAKHGGKADDSPSETR